MPVLISCPRCKQKLTVPAESLGQPVQCPPCGYIFAARAEETPAPPPPAPAPPSPGVLTACSECKRQLRVPEAALGKEARCPSCGAVFRAIALASFEEAPPAPKPAPVPKSETLVRERPREPAA